MHYSIVWLVFLSLLYSPFISASSIIITGNISANREVVLSTRIMGRITNVHAEEGDRVELGQVIIELDDREYQARLKIAQAARERAEAELAQRQRTRKRLQELTENNAMSQDAMDEAVYRLEVAQANMKSAQAEIESIRSTLSETQIKVPFDAIVIKKIAEEGLVTQPGQALYEIQDQSRLKFRARVKERDLARIKVDDKAQLTISAMRSEPLEAKVTKVIPSGDSRHTFMVEMSVPDSPDLFPGMFGKAVFE